MNLISTYMLPLLVLHQLRLTAAKVQYAIVCPGHTHDIRIIAIPAPLNNPENCNPTFHLKPRRSLHPHKTLASRRKCRQNWPEDPSTVCTSQSPSELLRAKVVHLLPWHRAAPPWRLATVTPTLGYLVARRNLRKLGSIR